jgi:hypothetical protein
MWTQVIVRALLQVSIGAGVQLRQLQKKEFQNVADEDIIKQGIVACNGNAGVLCLTNKSLRFDTTKANVNYISYPLEAVVDVRFKRLKSTFISGFEVEYNDGRQETFYLRDREDWVAKILDARASRVDPEQFEQSSDGTVLNQEQVAIRRKISTHFDDNEIQTLCFDLGIEYENLPANTKEGKTRELIIHCEQNGLLLRLLKLCQKQRPHIDWI